MKQLIGGAAGAITAVPAGTAAAPSIAFEGDANTGIYSSGADQVAISTSGAGRVFVNNTGLGVGISASRSIDVYRGDAGQAILRLSDADSRNVEFRSPDGTGNQGSIGTVTNHDFIGLTNNTERARIDSSGRLGLGVSSPTSLLHLADAGHITVGTTTGTKFGTATTQKIGFYNATPVVQPTAVADATTAVDVITQLNALLAKLRTLGIIAT